MKKTLLNLFAVATMLTFSFSVFGQGVTTASIEGRIVDDIGEALIGANVYAVHTPSGTAYGTSTDLEGYYHIPNMRVGGPYLVTVSYTGYGVQEFTGVILRLGERQNFDAVMLDNTSDLVTVEVTAQAGTAGENAGTSTQINSEAIESLPTLNRDISDFTRLTPQSTGINGGTSFAGTNSRFNAIYIDGAVNNDVFGLAGSGTNGGQTGAAPFSIDIIDQFQVVLSPYDVSLGGFAGGGVNAVTKSGTNTFSGTAYYFNQNENLGGKTPGRLAERLGPDFERTKNDPFKQQTFGASLGGPLIENKLFFFANVEFQRDETPNPFEFDTYIGNSTAAQLDGLRNNLIDNFGYDPGTFGSVSDNLDASRFFVKLDWNLNENHRMVIRHNYNKLESFGRNAGNVRTINFSNNGVFFPSTTNSSAVELNSTFGNSASNNLIVGFTKVNDDRGGLGPDFPRVVIDDGDGAIVFGTDEFSTGNLLEQTTFTLTDNFKLYRGKHTFTLGTHNEFYSIRNVFIRQAFGSYDFDSLDDFLSGAPASQYDRTLSLIDENPADQTDAAADFNAAQLGFYIQDEISVDDRLTVTAGMRVDIPILTGDVPVLPGFDSSLAKMAAFYPIANEVETGTPPSGQLLFSPRVGFNYNLNESGTSRLRGGVGVFTSRIPFVWPGAIYSNNGTLLTSIDERDIEGDINFIADPNAQFGAPAGTTLGGQVDLFTDNFKYPQVFRGNLGYDLTLPSDWKFTFEGIYSKTLNNIVVTNINSDPTVDFLAENNPNDFRPVFTRNRIAPEVGGDVYLVSNTNRGYTYSLTASATKTICTGLVATLAYTFGDANAINEGTSSQNSSQWRGQLNTAGRNNPVFGRSDFALGQRVVGTLNYTTNWGGNEAFGTTFSLFFDGLRGSAYSYVVGPERNFSAQNFSNESGSVTRNRSLVYVPETAADLNLVDITNDDGMVTLSAQEQWDNLNAFIEDDGYLSENRGQIADKNGSYLPFQGFFDLAIRQNLGFQVGNTFQRLQVSVDIFNFANLLNNNWGTRYVIPGGDFNNRPLYNFVGFSDADPTLPEYTYTGGRVSGREGLDISAASRWQARLGIRYLFN